MNKTLIIIGLFIIMVGLLWPLLTRLPFGRLPGDFVVRREGFSIFLPFTSMIIVSLVLTLLLWFLKK